ncbi:MAG: hypothetical protein LBR26_05960 [Prevotella sp.]|nr:hypothetical protein [Prevotella sp.]
MPCPPIDESDCLSLILVRSSNPPSDGKGGLLLIPGSILSVNEALSSLILKALDIDCYIFHDYRRMVDA